MLKALEQRKSIGITCCYYFSSSLCQPFYIIRPLILPNCFEDHKSNTKSVEIKQANKNIKTKQAKKVIYSVYRILHHSTGPNISPPALPPRQAQLPYPLPTHITSSTQLSFTRTVCCFTRATSFTAVQLSNVCVCFVGFAFALT